MLFLPKCLSFDFPGLQRKRCFSTGKCLCLGMPVKISFTTLAVLLPLQFYYPWPLLGHLNRCTSQSCFPTSPSALRTLYDCVCALSMVNTMLLVTSQWYPGDLVLAPWQQWHLSSDTLPLGKCFMNSQEEDSSPLLVMMVQSLKTKPIYGIKMTAVSGLMEDVR